MSEIVLPETKPETEWVLGRPLQKVSPTRKHGLVQLAVAMRLVSWAGDRGQVVTEWRFRLTPPGEITRPLVPDVAYVANARLAALTPQERETPPIAPDIVVEVLSPDDRAADVEDKQRVYLAAGTAMVMMFDPDRRTLDVFEAGAQPQSYVAGERFVSVRFPDLTFSLDEVFAQLDLP